MPGISIIKPNRNDIQKLETSKENYNVLIERIKPFLKGGKKLQKSSKSEWHFNDA